MEFYCYILYSQTVDRYYIGYTSDLNERLKLHRTGYFKSKSYTYKAEDWKIYLQIPCRTIEQALYLEKKIKAMKSRKYLKNLRKYPEMVERLIRESENKGIY